MHILTVRHYQIINLLTLFFLIISSSFVALSAAPQINIYNWSNSIHWKILQKFTEETGIKVNIDAYDNGDLMEVKMLAGNSGYDVVFVTANPYLERQSQLGVYMPLSKDKLKNYKLLDPRIMQQLSKSDPGNKFGIPYLWGTTGFGLNRTKILELVPDAPLDSFALFFDPEIVKKISPCGVVLLDSPIEVFPAVLSYLGLDPNSSSLEDLKKATDVLLKVKPYIRKFQPVVTPQELTSGETCLVQGWSGDVILAQRLIEKSGGGAEIEYYVAKEGGFIWIDVMAIPADAPHPELAYKFIDFVMRPDNIAKITNSLKAANAIPASFAYIKKPVRDNHAIYPPPEDMEKLEVDVLQTAQFERQRSRAWTRVKTGR